MRSWIYHHSGLVVGITPASFEASHRKGGIVDVDPKKRIAELEKKIEVLECIADLRRKQKRELKRQIELMKRGIIGAWKSLQGEK